jgi:hypothetical protein
MDNTDRRNGARGARPLAPAQHEPAARMGLPNAPKEAWFRTNSGFLSGRRRSSIVRARLEGGRTFIQDSRRARWNR